MFKSKTMWFAIALAVLSVLQGFIVQLPLSTAAQAGIGCVVAALIAVLRILTTQPLSDK